METVRINTGCFKSLRFEAICYAEIGNKYRKSIGEGMKINIKMCWCCYGELMLYSVGPSEEPYELCVKVKHFYQPHDSLVKHAPWVTLQPTRICVWMPSGFPWTSMLHREAHYMAQSKTGRLGLCDHGWNMLQTTDFTAGGVDKEHSIQPYTSKGISYALPFHKFMLHVPFFFGVL